MLNAIIIDDEQNGCEILEILLSQHCPDVNIVASVNNIEDAISSIIDLKPQLVFLDIELDNGTGFEILSHRDIQKLQFSVIFTTAYEQYAIEAIKNNALDYLLKPIDLNELKTAIDRVVKKGNNNEIEQIVNDLKLSLTLSPKLKLVNRKGFDLVDIKSIIYCKSEANYTRFYFDNKSTILTSKTLKTYQEELEKNGFMRVHKGHIVNLNKILNYTQGKIGQITMINRDTLGISKSLNQPLMEKLNSI